MSASSWWRKVDRDSSTPARNDPSAIDSPPVFINSAAPSTTSRAAPVITSRALASDSSRNSGFSRKRPAAISPPSAARPMAMDIQRERSWVSAPGARKATAASRGTIDRSSSSRMLMTRWPRGVLVSPRSSRI